MDTGRHRFSPGRVTQRSPSSRRAAVTERRCPAVTGST